MSANFKEVLVKDGVRKEVYWSVTKRQMIEDGWARENETPAPKREVSKLPQIVVEAGVEAFSPEATKIEEEPSEDLEDMTKAELLEWAMERGVDLPNNDRKAEILEACKKIEAED